MYVYINDNCNRFTDTLTDVDTMKEIKEIKNEEFLPTFFFLNIVIIFYVNIIELLCNYTRFETRKVISKC